MSQKKAVNKAMNRLGCWPSAIPSGKNESLKLTETAVVRESARSP